MSVDTTNLGTVVSWRLGGGRRGIEASGRFWRNASPPGPGNPSRGWRWGWIIAGALVLGVCLLSLLWLINLLRLPRPARLVLVGAGYEANLQLPHNSYGWRGLQDLAALSDQPVSSWVARACAARYGGPSGPIRLGVEGKNRWGESLKDVPEPTIVVVMALHGGVDAEGAYLLPQNAKALPESRDRLRMTEVLGLFRGLPRPKKKVLILDAAGMPYHWELGMLRNDFARELKKLEPEIKKIPNFVVINASDDDQRSWASDAWGRTAFLHFLTRALGGEAGGSPTGPSRMRGARVNLEQVFDYLAVHVKNWAAVHCDALQEPLILPAGDAGRRVARSIELPSIRGLAEPRPSESKEPTSIEQAIVAPWEAYRKLAASVVQPGVASPISWRRYQQLIGRYQELLRAAGPTGEADYVDILAAIDAQRREIEQSRTIGLNAAQSATLTIPVAEGAARATGDVLDPAVPAPDVQSWFAKPWWAPAEGKERSIWTERKGNEASGDARNLTAQVGDLVLRQAIGDPAGNLGRAARLAKLLDQPTQRPAELNFLIMLDRDLPATWKTVTGGVELVHRALEIRRLAERAALGLAEQTAGPDQVVASPLVAAWIGGKIAEADTDRRQAEDLLFASDLGNSVNAAYDQAERAYKVAIAAADKVRSAILTRDRALSDLVPITEWLATWYPPVEQGERLEKLVAATEGLWQNVHGLGRILETPDFDKINPVPTATNGAPHGVEATADSVARVHGLLKTAIDEFLSDCLSATALPSRIDQAAFERRAIVDALSLPWLGKERRLEMLRRGSEQFGGGNRGRIGEDTMDMSQAVVNVDRQNGDRRVGVRRRLAVAMLGVDETPGLPATAAEPDEEGRRIARKLERRVAEIKELAGRSDSPPGPDWAAKLAGVDRLARMLDSVSNEQVYSQSGSVDGLRFLRLEDYLVGQARRTQGDLWHDESGAASPYHQRVAGAYLEDAQRIDKSVHGARSDRIAAIRTGLGQAEAIRIAGPDTLIVTSEMRSGFRYRIEADLQPDLRNGQAVVWLQSGGDGLKIDQPADPGRRQAVSLGASAAGQLDVTLAFPKIATDPNATAARSSLVGHAYFRGRSIRKETVVDRHLIPSRRVVRTPPPPGGGIVVSADPSTIGRFGAGGGAVAIVLDASGSMRPAPGQQGPSKFQEATQALRIVLSHVPPGTVVSLWIFGEALGELKTTQIAERTIRCVQKPVAWEPALLEPLINQIAAIEPWNQSPILRAMLSAAEDLRGATGFNTMLVLTDGMDNRWKTDRQINPNGLDVAAGLRASFASSDIAVNVVAFRVTDPKDQQEVRMQFEGVTTFDAPGLFATAEESQSLVEALDRAMRPALRYTIDAGDKGPVSAAAALGFPVQPAQAGTLGETQGLLSGGYQLRLLTADVRRCRFAINDGDWLLVNILSGPAGSIFEHQVYSRAFFGLRPASEELRSGWRLSAIQNQFVEPSALRMTATFEKPQDPREAILHVVRPREIWFDVETAGAKKSQAGMSVKVVDQWGYPAPAWRIDVAGWPVNPLTPTPATPALQVWWGTDGEASPDVRLERGQDFRVADDLELLSPNIDGQPVTIESVQIEDHEVEVGDGIKQIRSCLVVRLNYPKGQPVWSRPYGLGIEGWDHRFYEDVSKYTGLFWPVTRSQLDSSLRRLALISVERFKRDAKRRGTTLRLDNLEPPTANDGLPPRIRPSATMAPPDALMRRDGVGTRPFRQFPLQEGN
jgi:hypothetical protein